MKGIDVSAWQGTIDFEKLKNVNQTYYIEKESHVIKNSFKRLFNTFKNIKSHKKIFIF